MQALVTEIGFRTMTRFGGRPLQLLCILQRPHLTLEPSKAALPSLVLPRTHLQVLRAPLSFFHTNPTGRVLNRFSRDQGAVDELLPQCLFDSLQALMMVLGAFVLVSGADVGAAEMAACCCWWRWRWRWQFSL